MNPISRAALAASGGCAHAHPILGWARLDRGGFEGIRLSWSKAPPITTMRDGCNANLRLNQWDETKPINWPATRIATHVMIDT